MSDDFIPLNQSTPVQHQWNQGRKHNNHPSGFRNFQNGKRGWNQRGNNSRNNSFSSDNNSYNSSCSNGRPNIEAYLHPSMLEDPWAKLREKKKNCS